MIQGIINRNALRFGCFYKTLQINRSLSSNGSLKKTNEGEVEAEIIQKTSDDELEGKKKRTPRKTPFKYYFDDDERDKTKIVFYEKFFDRNAQVKSRENFMSAIEAFRLTNPSKNMYIDFIYGALLKMKEYNAHNHLEAYRKLMELFPIGPLKSMTPWSRENFHFPRHQSAALQILEQLERNGIIIDEEMAALTIRIFGDWTHVVRKAKRQLYWLPKFKNANPYPVPSIQKLECLTDFEIALAAIERITKCADKETKISAFKIKENDFDTNEKWLISAQSSKQKDLLKKHKKATPIFVEGPNFTWIRDKLVNYYVLKTDPLPETQETQAKIEKHDVDDFSNIPNMFNDPFKKSSNKKAELSVHEQLDGTIYAICATETSSKISVNHWTKILEEENGTLKDLIIVYRVKEKLGEISVLEDLDEKTD